MNDGSGFLRGFLTVGIIGASAWFILPILFPFCDQTAKAKAFERYNERMRKAALPTLDITVLQEVENGKELTKSYTWDVSVDAAIALERDLKACHCADRNIIEEVLNKVKP